MPDTKVFSPGLVTYWWVGAGGIANINAPTPAEINAGINLSAAVAEDGTNVGATESTDIDDRSIVDAGNAVEPGFGQFEAALNLFRPKSLADVNDPYVKAYNAFKTQRVAGFIVKRVNAPYSGVAVAGDEVSVFKVLSAYTANDASGEDSVKFLVQFLPQGAMSVYTRVQTATPLVLTPTTLSITAASPLRKAVVATLSGVDETTGVTWTTSDATKAIVENGQVKGVAAGTATITVTAPWATGTPPTCTVTVT